MIAATFIAILFVPLFFSLLTRRRAVKHEADGVPEDGVNRP